MRSEPQFLIANNRWHLTWLSHKTLKVRGILCGRCNRALGMLNDDPIKIQRLADYALATMRLPHL